MKKVLKITESQYKSLLLFEQGDTKFDIKQNQKNIEPLKNKKQNSDTGFKMDYNKLKSNPTPEYIAAVIKNSKGKWNDEEAWAQSAFESIKDYDTYNKVKQILKADPYKFVKSFMDTDEDYHNNGNTIDKLYYKIHNLEGAGTPFKMDYKKLKNNPSPKYIADVLENSKGDLGDDKEAWAQSAFESIKNQETYNKVQEFLGGNDPYEFVKSFMSTNIDYHDNGNTIDKLYDNLFPENPRFHFICNDLSARKSKYGTIPKHGEKCYSCGTELRNFCSSKGEVATLKTMKGSYWDGFFGNRDEKELPMYGGHWDNDEYTYCVCAKGETKKSGNDYYFLEDKKTYISAAPSKEELKLIRQQRLKYLNLVKKNADSSLLEAFDCSVYRKEGDEKSWWKYQQCLTENLSMAVSVVPVIGTAVSAILDATNALSYLGSAFFGSSERIQNEDFLMAAISLGSILPVFGEVRSVIKIGSKEAKATQKILKELKEGGLKELKSAGKFDDSFSMINNAYTKHTSDLNSLQKKNVNKTLENINKINPTEINNQIKVLQDILEGYEKQGLKEYHLHKLLKDKNFIDLLNKNGNDLSKTLKSQQGKEMITNIIVQLGVGGFMGSINTKLNKLEKETEKRKNTSLKSLGYSDKEIAKIEREVQAKVTINIGEEIKIIDKILEKNKNKPPEQKIDQEIKDTLKNIKTNMVITKSVDELKEKGNTTNITPQTVIDTTVQVNNNFDILKEMDKWEMEIVENLLYMKNKIIITESQFKRLFLEQSSSEDCEKDEDSKELLDKVKEKYGEKNPDFSFNKQVGSCLIKLYDDNFNIYLHVNDDKIAIKDKNYGYIYISKYKIEGNEIKILEKPISYNKDKYPEWQYVTPKILRDIFNSNKQNIQPPKPSESDETLNELIKQIDDDNCETILYLSVDFNPKKIGKDEFCSVMKSYVKKENKTPLEEIMGKDQTRFNKCFKEKGGIQYLKMKIKEINNNNKYYRNNC